VSILSEDNQTKIKQLIISSNLITQADLQVLEKGAADAKIPFLSYIVQEGKVTAEQLTKLTADVLGLPYVNLVASKISSAVLNLLPLETAERFMAVPLGEMQHRLAVAMLDPNNVQAVDFLANKIGKALKVYMASEEGIRHVLEMYNTNLQEGVSEAITSVDSELEGDESLKEIMQTGREKRNAEKEEVATIVQDSPISRALSTILEYAVRARASDIHIEPQETSLRIRCRVDGVPKRSKYVEKLIREDMEKRGKDTNKEF
jgi:type II secretory ATPase GspE/PulE/Tfp pilus assembly ATPase PilB-like protein